MTARHDLRCLSALALAAAMAPAGARSPPADTPATVPSDGMMACLTTAEKSWKIRKGNVAGVSSKSIGGGLYEVELVARGHKATCTVDGAGTVRSIKKRK